MVVDRVLSRLVTSHRKGTDLSLNSFSFPYSGMKSLSSLITATYWATPFTKSAIASMAIAISAEFFDCLLLKCWIPLTVTVNCGNLPFAQISQSVTRSA